MYNAVTGVRRAVGRLVGGGVREREGRAASKRRARQPPKPAAPSVGSTYRREPSALGARVAADQPDVPRRHRALRMEQALHDGLPRTARPEDRRLEKRREPPPVPPRSCALRSGKEGAVVVPRYGGFGDSAALTAWARQQVKALLSDDEVLRESTAIAIGAVAAGRPRETRDACETAAVAAPGDDGWEVVDRVGRRHGGCGDVAAGQRADRVLGLLFGVLSKSAADAEPAASRRLKIPVADFRRVLRAMVAVTRTSVGQAAGARLVRPEHLGVVAMRHGDADVASLGAKYVSNLARHARLRRSLASQNDVVQSLARLLKPGVPVGARATAAQVLKWFGYQVTWQSGAPAGPAESAAGI